MIITNGYVRFKAQQAGAIDSETGYREAPTDEAWGDPVECQFVHARYDQLAMTAEGEHYKDVSFEIYLEDDAPTPSKRLQLTDLLGVVIGEYSVVELRPLEAVCEKLILV